MCRIYLPRKGLAVFADGERLSYVHKKGSGVVMASLKYEIATHVYNAVKYKKEEEKDKDSNPSKTPKITERSKRQYLDRGIKFGMWCKATYGCRHFDDCREHIQDYADYLTKEGYSASTIHTYLAGVCRIWEIDMDMIQKPVRHVAQNTRSRGEKAVDKRKDAQREASPRLYDFAMKVGLRRREYLRLYDDSLVEDESGYPCIRVRGKGGKVQYQRILPADIQFVCSYFTDKDADECIFDRKELTNKIDLHHLRASQAKRAYLYYLDAIRDPAFKEQLIRELEARFEANGRQLNHDQIDGKYYLRGLNRKFAQEHNLPTAYNRLALMAVSVYHLSHWRLDVTVCNYILAV